MMLLFIWFGLKPPPDRPMVGIAECCAIVGAVAVIFTAFVMQPF